jgi:hypothetical protein
MGSSKKRLLFVMAPFSAAGLGLARQRQTQDALRARDVTRAAGANKRYAFTALAYG